MSPDKPKTTVAGDGDARDDDPANGEGEPESATTPKPDADALLAIAGKVREKFSNRRWFCGVGITRDASGPSLRLDVDPDFQDDDDIPDTFQGFELVVTPFSAHKPRPGRPRTEDETSEVAAEPNSGRWTGRRR